MLTTKFPKTTLGRIEAFEQISSEVWLETVADMLETPEIVRMRAVSVSFRTMWRSDDLWLDKLTLLALQHPTLADLEQGASESAYNWYKRCNAAAADGVALALAHKRGEQPYLAMYGIVDGSSFTPHATLRFQIPRGFIAELITLKAAAGCRDPPMDALECFEGAPPTSDGAFRLIQKTAKEALRMGCSLKRPQGLPNLLASTYAPQPRKVEVSSEMSADDLR